MNSLISVIIPVYNIENHLEDFRRCIQSVLSQTYGNFELLLINDGSADQTGRICEDYACKDDRIKLLQKQNGGVSSARNMGLEHAAGEWVMFIDDDDWIEKDCLETCMKGASPDMDLIMFSCNWKEEERLPNVECCSCSQIAKILPRYFSTIIFTTVWAKLYKRENIVSSSLTFDTALRNCEDTEFTYKYLALCNHILFLSDQFYHYELRGASLSKNKYMDWSKQHVILSKIYAAIDEVEKTFDISLMNARCLYSEIRINNFLPAISALPFFQVRGRIKTMLEDPCIDCLFQDNQYRPKGRRRKLLDWLALHEFYMLFALYVKIIHAGY